MNRSALPVPTRFSDQLRSCAFRAQVLFAVVSIRFMIEIRHHLAAILLAALALMLLGAAPPSPFPARPQTAQNPTTATPENRAPETAPQNMPPMSPPAFQSNTPGRFRCPYDFWIASS